MKTLSRALIPRDFIYYRTGSRVFYEYYKNHSKTMIERIGNGFEFIKIGRVFGLSLWSIIAEKVDQEPSVERLRQLGMRHGIISWVPMRIIEKPKGWFGFPHFLIRYFELFHSTRSAFSILDRPDYWNKWSSKARAHRRKILEYQKNGKIRIEEIRDGSIYLDIYRKTRVPDPHKTYLIGLCEHIFADSFDHIRIYIAYVDEIPLAGAIFIDEWVTSEYFTSFYARESHPYHLGAALMDRWFLDSYQKGIKYCDLDHMRDRGQLLGYAGYTKFKESIADHDVYFHDLWVKIF